LAKRLHSSLTFNWAANCFRHSFHFHLNESVLLSTKNRMPSSRSLTGARSLSVDSSPPAPPLTPPPPRKLIYFFFLFWGPPLGPRFIISFKVRPSFIGLWPSVRIENNSCEY
jgi:hypothetical protein